MAMLMITHDLGVVANVAEEVVVMYRGRVMESGSIEDLYRSPEHPYLKALMAAVPRFDMTPGERLVPIRDIKSETGHLLAETESKPKPELADVPILKVNGLDKTYAIRKGGWLSSTRQTIHALDDVGFEIRRGECLGLVGESGCGKTTLSKVIMRALSPDAGSVHFIDEEGDTDVLALEGDPLIAFRKSSSSSSRIPSVRSIPG